MIDRNIYKVIKISYAQAKPWILKKHYAHRVPVIQYSFGLFKYKKLIGICTFGLSGNRYLNNYIELNRLIVEDGEKKNVTSILVSKSLKLLPKPNIIISYADPNQGHVGYIYQATNWIYTGLSASSIVWEKDGIEYHNKSVWEKFNTNKKSVIEKEGYI